LVKYPSITQQWVDAGAGLKWASTEGQGKLKYINQNKIHVSATVVPIRATMACRNARETPSPTTACADDLFSPRYVLICRRKIDTYRCNHRTVSEDLHNNRHGY